MPGGASSVTQAKEALKPTFVRTRENLLGVPTRLRNRRKNAAFLRQGEWFFVPVSAWGRDPINEKFILRHEPLRRGAGKAHIVEALYRVVENSFMSAPNVRTASRRRSIGSSSRAIPKRRNGVGRRWVATRALTHGAAFVIRITPRSRCRVGTVSC